MSRPQKMHKPLKFTFTEVINAVADGKGVELQARKARAKESRGVKKSGAPNPKKP